MATRKLGRHSEPAAYRRSPKAAAQATEEKASLSVATRDATCLCRKYLRFARPLYHQ